jgi:GTPase
MDELERLCETAGLVLVGRESQSMQNPSPSTFIGAGKLDEIVAVVHNKSVTHVIFDDELSPAQGRNVQKVLGPGVQV